MPRDAGHDGVDAVVDRRGVQLDAAGVGAANHPDGGAVFALDAYLLAPFEPVDKGRHVGDFLRAVNTDFAF
nr:hypothetical protein [Natronomonas sp. CBA1123]